ncbi:MAG: MEDS domain-containing protein [Candidatus Eremiobacteraeota bacterium]|nr:MEDS domain-containing protein [Candidatus Eremiobacteraeota bacterium]
MPSSEPHGHLVQLYEDSDDVLVHDVAAYLFAGLEQGQGIVVVATTAHRDAFVKALQRLGANVDRALATRTLKFFDAHFMLASFMVNGSPDGRLFDEVIGSGIRAAHARAAGRGLSVYGEMVGELWKTRQYRAAIDLERLWNTLRESLTFHLYCSYPVDLFDGLFEIGTLDEVLGTHTHLVPAGRDRDFESAVTRAMNDVLGSSGQGLRPLIEDRHRHAWAAMPRGAATLVWLRRNFPDKQEEIVRLTRHYYQSTQALSRAH